MSRINGMRAPLAVTTLLAVALWIGGCASKEEIRGAINAVNTDFRVDYEKLIKARGTRAFEAPRAQAFAAMERALTRLGMAIESKDAAAGYLRASAPAPRPLSLAEWKRATAVDQPRLQEIVRRHAGLIGWFVSFEPEGLDVVLHVTLRQRTPSVVAVSVTMRLKETAPPKSGIPRREYPPPTAFRVGLEKFWRAFEQALAAT